MFLDLGGQFGQLDGMFLDLGGQLGQLDGVFLDLDGQLGQLDGVLLDLGGQFGQLGRVAFYNAAQIGYLAGLISQLMGMLRGRFGQGFGYGAERPGFLGKLGQLPRHGQQLGSQQPVAQGFRPFGLFVDDPVQVDNGVDSERGGHGSSILARFVIRALLGL